MCILDVHEFLNSAAEMIHSNQEHKENHNIYLSNIKHSTVKIFENEWKLKHIEEVYPKLIKNILDMLDKYDGTLRIPQDVIDFVQNKYQANEYEKKDYQRISTVLYNCKQHVNS